MIDCGGCCCAAAATSAGDSGGGGERVGADIGREEGNDLIWNARRRSVVGVVRQRRRLFFFLLLLLFCCCCRRLCCQLADCLSMKMCVYMFVLAKVKCTVRKCDDGNPAAGLLLLHGGFPHHQRFVGESCIEIHHTPLLLSMVPTYIQPQNHKITAKKSAMTNPTPSTPPLPPPGQPRFVLCDETSISIEWDADDSLTYQIQYKEYPQPWEEARTVQVPHGESKMPAYLPNCQPCSTYNIRLVAVREEDGAVSAPGEEIIIDTMQADCNPTKKMCCIC